MSRSNYPDADGQFSHAPILNHNDDHLKFDTNDVDKANARYGSASGLVPKISLSEKALFYS